MSHLRLAIVNGPEWMTVGQLINLHVDNIPNDMWDVFEDMVFFAGHLEAKHLRISDAMMTVRGAHRVYSDVDFRIWKLGNWSTARLDGIWRMNKEQAKYWLGEK